MKSALITLPNGKEFYLQMSTTFEEVTNAFGMVRGTQVMNEFILMPHDVCDVCDKPSVTGYHMPTRKHLCKECKTPNSHLYYNLNE